GALEGADAQGRVGVPSGPRRRASGGPRDPPRARDRRSDEQTGALCNPENRTAVPTVWRYGFLFPLPGPRHSANSGTRAEMRGVLRPRDLSRLRRPLITPLRP